MFSRDFAGGIAAIITGSVYLYYTLQIRSSPLADTIGPTGIPKVLGVLMVLLGVLLSLQAMYTALKSSEPVPSEWTGQYRLVLRAAGLLVLGIMYLLIVKTLGYPISIAILLLLTTLYMGARFNWRVPAIAACGGLALWLLFDRLLGIAMPSGTF